MVEIEYTGRELSRFSAKADTTPDPRQNPIHVLPWLTPVTAGKIAFLGQDGYSYHFDRP